MAIENYIQIFAVEAAPWSDSPKPAGQGIKAVWLDLDNTPTHPDGTPEMKQWLHDLRDAGIRIIVVSNNTKNGFNAQLRNLGLSYWA